MRLDHLLSKELSEGEIRKTHPKVDQSEMTVEESAKSTGCRLKTYSLYRFQGLPWRSGFSALQLVWGFSSVGRAPALQAGGQRFEPANLHHMGR